MRACRDVAETTERFIPKIHFHLSLILPQRLLREIYISPLKLFLSKGPLSVKLLISDGTITQFAREYSILREGLF